VRARCDLAELAQVLGCGVVLAEPNVCPDCHLEPDASLDPATFVEPAEIAVGQLCRLGRLVAIERQGGAAE
jgi:hypothetical protein